MKTQEFLSENREVVINYYNEKITPYWNVSLKNFMLDVLNNFEKVATTPDLIKMDLMMNLYNAQRRLGMFDKRIGTTYTKPYSESNHAKAVNYFGEEKVSMMANA